MKSIKITLITLGLLVLSVGASYAQIKIGKNPTTINTSSILEIESDTKGVLLPRIPLESTTSFAPLSAHVAGMIVYNTATAGTTPNNVVPGFYYNDGTKWLNLADLAVTNEKLAANAVTTDKILDGTILAADMATGAVTTTQILDGTILTTDMAVNAVETANIKDANVTTAKIASGGNNKVLVTDATGVVAWVDKTGFGAVADLMTIEGAGTTASSFKVKDLGIVTAKLANDAVTTAKILDANVNTAKIADLNVTEGKLAADAVTTSKILNGTIIAEDIATGAVTTTQILDGTVATIDLADNAVTTAKILNANVTTDKIADANVTTAKLAADAVTTDKIANATIKNEDLNKTDIPLSGFAAAAASVDLGSQKLVNVQNPTDAQDAATKKYVDDATAAITTLAEGKIYLGNASNVATEVTMAGDVTISNIGATTIGASKVLTGMIADGTIITADLADNAVETAKIKNDAVTTAKILDANVTTAKIADANVTTAKIAPGTANQILVTNAASPVAVEWFTPTNTLTATNGALVSTVNGLASTPAVNVLISADNGLTATNGNVQLGGALTAATTITTDATKTLALAGLQDGANTDKMLVVDANGVLKSISANARNIYNIVKKTAAYTVADDDYTILADATTSGFTITLPAASTNEGRILLIRKTDESNNILTFSESIKYSETTSFTTLNYLSTIRIQSDGSAWYKID